MTACVLPQVAASITWSLSAPCMTQLDFNTLCNHTSPHTTTYIQQPFVPTLLIQAADIETNPGPGNEEILTSIEKLGEKLSNEIQGLSTDIKKLQIDMASLTTKQSNLEKDCQAINNEQRKTNSSIEKLNDEMKQLKDDRRKDAKTMNELTEKCDKLKESVSTLDKECDRLEGFSRRDNVRFFNIPETPDENCKQKVLKSLRDNTTKEWSERDIIRAHRLGTRRGGPRGQPRPLIAKFAHSEDKIFVLNSREELRPAGIKVASDLTKRQRDTLKRVSEETGKRCYFKGQKLVIPDDTPRDRDSSSDDEPPQSPSRRPNKRARERTPQS